MAQIREHAIVHRKFHVSLFETLSNVLHFGVADHHVLTAQGKYKRYFIRLLSEYRSTYTGQE